MGFTEAIIGLLFSGIGWMFILTAIVFFYLMIKTSGNNPDIKLRGARIPVLAVIAIVSIVSLWNSVTAIPTTPSTSSVTPQGVTQVSTATENVVVAGKQCTRYTSKKNELDVAIRNKENSSNLGYIASSLSANDGSTTLQTGTTTAGASLTYSTLSVEGCKDVQLYGLATSGVGSASFKASTDTFEPSRQLELNGAGQNVVNVLVVDKNGGRFSSSQINGSTEVGENAVSGAGTSDGTAYTTNTTLGQDGSISNMRVDYALNGTSAVFGAYEATDGTIFSYDANDNTKFSPSSLSLQDKSGIGLTQLSSCPATITANRQAEKCWSARTLKVSDGTVSIGATLKADLGNPTATGDNPKLCLDDKVYFRDTNGQIAYDYFNSAGTQQGVGGTCVEFVVN